MDKIKLIRPVCCKTTVILLFSFSFVSSGVCASATVNTLINKLQKRSMPVLQKQFKSARRSQEAAVSSSSTSKRDPGRLFRKNNSRHKPVSSRDYLLKAVKDRGKKEAEDHAVQRAGSVKKKDIARSALRYGRKEPVNSRLSGDDSRAYGDVTQQADETDIAGIYPQQGTPPFSQGDETWNILADTFGGEALDHFVDNAGQGTMEGYAELVEEMGPSFTEFVSELGDMVGFDSSLDFAEAFDQCGWGLLAALEDVNESGLEEVRYDLEEITDIYGQRAMEHYIDKETEAFAVTVEKNCVEGDFAQLVDDLNNEFDRREVWGLFKEFGFTGINQFLPGDLEVIAENRLKNEDDGSSPLAVLVYGNDPGAFSSDDAEIHEMIERGFNVMYYNADTGTEAISAMQDATHDGENQASAIIFGGHGTSFSLYFNAETEGGYLDTNDYQELKDLDVSLMLEEGGTVVLNACSTGSGGENIENMANFMAAVFDTAGHVFAPADKVSAMDIEYEGNKIIDVSWQCCYKSEGEVVSTWDIDTYDAALYRDSREWPWLTH